MLLLEKLAHPVLLAGSEGFDKMLPTPSGRQGLNDEMESTIDSLERAVWESQKKCFALSSALGHSESSSSVKELTEKLESMQQLVKQLRSQL